ncbi:hypothetical protein [Enterococcus sp. LJL90]
MLLTELLVYNFLILEGKLTIDFFVEFTDLTKTDWWNSNFITAILSLSGVIFSVGLTYLLNWRMSSRNERFQKELSLEHSSEQKRLEHERKEFEERMQKLQIDADLKASARIDWIQEVRKLTSKFVTNLNGHIESDNGSWPKIENDKNLFTLYFGPDSGPAIDNLNTDIFVDKDQIVVTQEAKRIMLNSFTNSKKNNYIVKYIDVLFQFYKNPIRNAKMKKIKELEYNRELLYRHGDFEYEEVFDEEEGQYITVVSDVILNDKLQETEDRLNRKIEHLGLIANNYVNDLDFFNEIMRIYFKVEWNRAKKGE